VNLDLTLSQTVALQAGSFDFTIDRADWTGAHALHWPDGYYAHVATTRVARP